MDVERTILESQLRADRRRADRLDKHLQVTADMIRAEVKMIRHVREKTDFKFKALMDSQRRTDEQVRKREEASKKHEEGMRKSDEKFNRLLEKLSRRHPNGRH